MYTPVPSAEVFVIIGVTVVGTIVVLCCYLERRLCGKPDLPPPSSSPSTTPTLSSRESSSMSDLVPGGWGYGRRASGLSEWFYACSPAPTTLSVLSETSELSTTLPPDVCRSDTQGVLLLCSPAPLSPRLARPQLTPVGTATDKGSTVRPHPATPRTVGTATDKGSAVRPHPATPRTVGTARDRGRTAFKPYPATPRMVGTRDSRQRERPWPTVSLSVASPAVHSLGRKPGAPRSEES